MHLTEINLSKSEAECIDRGQAPFDVKYLNGSTLKMSKQGWINARGEIYRVNLETGEYMCTTPPCYNTKPENRLKSGRINKSGTPRLYGWEHVYRNNPVRRAVCQGDNIDFICQYLFKNIGAKYTEILRALCKYNRVPYHRGQYSSYFWYRSIENRKYPWEKCGRGWMLTPTGMVRAIDSQKTGNFLYNKR